MPDAATHILIQVIINQFVLVRKILPYTLLGAVAPDLLKAFSRWSSPEYSWLFYPTHSPIFMGIFFYSISMLFHQKERLFLITWCMAGMIIHLLLDLFQINLGGSYYMPFFPLSFHRVTFGLYETEASIFWLPVTILLTIMVILSKNILVKKER